jgi:hypothetical protein
MNFARVLITEIMDDQIKYPFLFPAISSKRRIPTFFLDIKNSPFISKLSNIK